MDERTPRTLVTDGPDAEHVSATVAPSGLLADQPTAPEADPIVVYCGDAARVREGFLLALSVMQASGNLLTPDIAPPAGNFTQEDN
jgi:hypothetical protein